MCILPLIFCLPHFSFKKTIHSFSIFKFHIYLYFISPFLLFTCSPIHFFKYSLINLYTCSFLSLICSSILFITFLFTGHSLLHSMFLFNTDTHARLYRHWCTHMTVCTLYHGLIIAIKRLLPLYSGLISHANCSDMFPIFFKVKREPHGDHIIPINIQYILLFVFSSLAQRTIQTLLWTC